MALVVMIVVALPATLTPSGPTPPAKQPATRLVSSTGPYTSAVLNDSPAVYYTLGESTGTTAHDSSGNRYDATYQTISNTITQGVTGKDSDNAVSSSGCSYTANYPSPRNLPSGDASRSADIWFKTTSTLSKMGLVTEGTLGNNELWALDLTNGNNVYVAAFGNDKTFSIGASYNDGTWHYVAASYDASSHNVTVYFDGRSLGTQSWGPLNTVDPTGLWIGSEPTNVWPFAGTLDEAAMYPSPLSSTRVSAHYSAGSGSSYASTVLADSPSAYYRLSDTGPTAADSSGGGNTAYYATGETLGVRGPLTTQIDHGADTGTCGGPIARYTSSTGLPSGDSSRTADVWFRTTSIATKIGLVGDGSLANNQLWTVDLTNGNTVYVAGFGNDRSFSIGHSYNDGQWHYLAASYDAGSHQLTTYFDGSSLGTQSWGPLNTVNSTGLWIGSEPSAGANVFYGTESEVALYPTALSSTRIAAHYNAGGFTPLSPSQTSPSGGMDSGPCDGGGVQANKTGSPVNTATGNFWHTLTDISIAGRSCPLAFAQTYSAQAAAAGTTGPLGFGWTDNYGMGLSITGSSPNQVATVTNEDGSHATFNQPSSGSSWPASLPRFIATLTQNPGGTWTYVRQGYWTYSFNSSGQLTAKKDPNGYTTSYSYTSGNLTTVTDPAGRTLTLNWTGTTITSAVDANVSGNTRTVSFTYDGSGNLTDVTDVNGGDTHFTYDSSHRVTVMKDPVCQAAGSSCPGVQNSYDSNSRVMAQSDQLGRTTTFSYTLIPNTVFVTTPAGNITADAYTDGVLTAETKGYDTAAAATTSYAYDASTLALEAVTDANGNSTAYTVDSSGNVLTTTDPLGRMATKTYNAFNEVLTAKDGNGVTTAYTYDGSGNLTSVSVPLTNTTATATNCQSPTIAVAIAQVTCYAHSNATYPGDVTSVTDPDGKVTSYNYDTYGNRDQVKDPLGNVADTGYNADDWLTARYTPKAGCTWNAAPPTGCSSSYATQYSYTIGGGVATNEFGDVQKVTDPLGHTTSYTNDANRNRTSITDGDGNTTTYAYDYANERCWTLPGGTSSNGCASPPANARVTDYNADGTVKDQKDGKGNAILSYGYDSRGDATSLTDALGNVTGYAFDLNGNVLTKLDPISGATCTGTQAGCTTYTYDGDNELKTVSYSDSAAENVTSISYDSDGQRTGMSDGTGSSSWAYDSLHRLTSYTNGNGDTVSYGYTYGSGPTYDLKNQVRSIAYPNAVGTVTQSWNDDGTLGSVTDWNSKTVSFTYDANANETGQTVPSTSNATDSFGYNTADHMTSVSASNGATLFSATYTRDGDAQLSSDSSVLVTVGNYKYTAVNQLCYAGSSNSNACTSPPAGSQAYGFDSADNLITDNGAAQQFNNADELCWSLTGSSGNSCSSPPLGATSYAYDAKGDRRSAVPAVGSATCDTYDQASRLTQIQTGSGATCTSPTTLGTYTYDGAGVRESKTVGSTTTHFTWDGRGALVLQQKAATAVTSFIYGPSGEPVEQIAGSTTTYLHHDQLGSTRLITDAAGSATTATTVTYDPYGNVTATVGSLTTPLLFTGQYQDSESGLYFLRARYYDPITAQFLSRDPAVSLTRSPYGYVGANPLNATDPSGLIDPGLLSDAQKQQIKNACSTWQNQSLCREAAFCMGDDCHTIAQVAIDDNKLVAAALGKSPCGDVTLLGGYKATHDEAERDLSETYEAFAVANQTISFENTAQGALVSGFANVAGGAASCAAGGAAGAEVGAAGVFVPGVGWFFEGTTTVVGCAVGVAIYATSGVRYQR